ncbi:hypothetical protein EVAR_84291_1 [Eumeta japonica]|uniref:Uncharacterized protein n=1 Tax=Eumeta variegata TaxID=151549 RepID=A0A4C1WUL4_EUMVA|nr:hypothetical protein EVAR_84291_1 [Eumeta japonica]
MKRYSSRRQEGTSSRNNTFARLNHRSECSEMSRATTLVRRWRRRMPPYRNSGVDAPAHTSHVYTKLDKHFTHPINENDMKNIKGCISFLNRIRNTKLIQQGQLTSRRPRSKRSSFSFLADVYYKLSYKIFKFLEMKTFDWN